MLLNTSPLVLVARKVGAVFGATRLEREHGSEARLLQDVCGRPPMADCLEHPLDRTRAVDQRQIDLAAEREDSFRPIAIHDLNVGSTRGAEARDFRRR